MNVIAFPPPRTAPTDSELAQETAELETLLEHVLDGVVRDHPTDLDAPLAYTARDFYLLARLLLLTRRQHRERMLALLALGGAR